MFDKLPSLVKFLIKDKLISEEELEAFIEKQKSLNLSLQDILIKEGVVSENQILKSLAKHLHLSFIEITPEKIEKTIIEKVPAKLATHYNFMPLKEEKGVMFVAINDPFDVTLQDEIRLFLKKEVKFFLAEKNDINQSVRKYYGIGADTVERMIIEDQELEILGKEQRGEDDIRDENIDPSAIKFVNQILVQSITDRATDIHFEPYENEFKIRYRIDGILYDMAVPATIKHFELSIVSRIKVMANLDIAEKRLPQDGRIKVKVGGKEFDLRVSILPTPLGESVNIRILTRGTILLGMESLGLEKEDCDIINSIIHRPHGIILVTGPTGSGKTTTLYAALNKINSTDKKILTIEDPIEYQLKGVTQMQVQPKIGFTFATGLRSMLRHDPDVMMVGEIRDLETVELAIRTALTGHLVFSTLHTNDAAGAVTRLLDMGIEPFLVTSSVDCIVAQRLVRIICEFCKEEYVPDKEVIKDLLSDQFVKTKPSKFYRGKGCAACKFSGYKGRTGIYEILLVDDDMRRLIMERKPSNIIKQKAVAKKMKTLRQDGLIKIIKGLTTPEEVLRVTQQDVLD
ncbi:MAG: ATPase, T2SS/T4P/T4SS family [Candidatus Omnitrophota bacterium]